MLIAVRWVPISMGEIHDYSPGGLSDANVHPPIHSFPLLGGGGGRRGKEGEEEEDVGYSFHLLHTYIHTYVTVCLLIIV